MLWLLLILAGIGAGVYLLDKRMKRKFEDKFNPRDWDLPTDADKLPGLDHQEAAKAAIKPLASGQESVRYEPKPRLFSDAERSLFDLLQAALNPDYRVLVKVSLGDVIQPRSQGSNDLKQTDLRLGRSFFNFVVCDKNQLKPLCGLMLKDEPGTATVSELALRAGLPLLVLDPARSYRMQEMRAEVLSQVTGAIVKVLEPMPAAAETALSVDVLQPRERLDTPLELKLCPKCQAVMLKRTAKTGPQQGKQFWACSTYPRCKGLVPLE